MFIKTKHAKPSRIRAFLVAVGLLATLATWRASLRVGAGPSAGWGYEGVPADAPGFRSTLRLGTLNIASGKAADGQYDLDRTVDALKAARLDFVALQEVRGSVWPEADNQAATLAQRLDLGWVYAPAETRWYCRQFGNGILGRLPVQSWQREPLPRQHDPSSRNVVLMRLGYEDRFIDVVATHLTQRDNRDRKEQLAAVISMFLRAEEPTVLMGDLNTTADDPALCDLLAKPGVDDPVGRLVPEAPKGRVDWILLRGLKAVAAGMSDKPVSDHPLYWVEVAWPAATNEEQSGPATPHKREVE